jgi:hypothetical protein
MAKSTRYPGSVLERMAVHIGYELRMVGCLMHDVGVDEEAPTSSAVLESYLLHVRTLSAFLGTAASRAWPDDIVADDYFRGYYEPVSPLTSDDRSDIDRRLAHLTIDRLGSNLAADSSIAWRPGLDRSYWGKRVLREFTRFLDALRSDSPDRAEWFEGALTDAKRHVLPAAGS